MANEQGKEKRSNVSKQATKLALGAIAAMCVAGGAFLLTRSEQGASPVAYEPLHCAFTKDESQSYRLMLEAKSKVDLRQLLAAGASGATPPVQDQSVRLQGDLHMRVLEASTKGATLSFAFEPDAKSVASWVTPEQLEQVRKPFAAKVDALCEFESFGFAPEVGSSVQNQLRGVLQSAQVVLPTKGTEPSWQHIEFDVSGKYGARYSRTSEGQRTLRKVKYGYVEVFPPESTGPRAASDKNGLSAQVRVSDTKVRWAENGSWFEQLASVERVLFNNRRGTFADITTTVKMDRLPEAKPSDGIALANAVWVSSSARPSPREQVIPEPPSRFKTMTLDEALQEALAFLKQKPPQHADAGRLLAMLMRAQPEMIAKLMELVRTDAMPAELHSAFFFGLEKTGTPEARQALVLALDDARLQPANRMRAAAALADIEDPDEQTIAALDRLAASGAGLKDPSDEQRLQNAATFALGTLEHNMRATKPELAKKARETIRTHLQKAGTDAVEITAALDAIHNSGHPEFIPALEPYFKSDTELVRKHAYEALARMPPDKTAALFEPLIQSESSAQQRALLAVTYTDQARNAQVPPPKSVWGAAAQQLEAERNTVVRASYVHLIGAAAESSPDAEQKLAQQYARESDPRMLKTIGRYVSADKLP